MSLKAWTLAFLSTAAFGAGCSSGSTVKYDDSDVGGARDASAFDAHGRADGFVGSDASEDGSDPPSLGGLRDSGPGSGGCQSTDPNADLDKDGFTPAQGDCNDCDPNVNPGAIDVLHQGDGGAPTWGDEDCDGTPGDSAKACDQGLALTDTAAASGVKAIELCATATDSDRKYGVLSAAYVRADGSAFPSPGLQVGIESAFGANVHVQAGANMLALSTGHARSVGQAGACNGISCQTNPTGTAPPGFPQDDPACPPTKVIADDIALEIKVRVPTNATGYSFSFKFYSFEFPDWVCDTHGYNDQFIALVTPAPAGSYVPSGSTAGNVSFDDNHHPVSVNLGYFDACDPSTPQRFATHCRSGGGTCPAAPSPYCPLGVSDLQGTGFDSWHASVGAAGGTRWLQTNAPAKGGSVITIRFAIWDAGNALFDSTVLLDDFAWIATGGTVAVGTQPVPSPR